MLKRKTHVLVFLSAFLFYLLSANLVIKQPSAWPHFVYLADAFLHGRMDLVKLPVSTHDLILFQNHWFVASAPAPAILMMPFVAIFGTSFSDVFFGVLIGATNVLLMYVMLGNLGLKETSPKRIWLTVLFAAGTVHWWGTSLGTYWLNAHSVAVMFMILYVNETILDRRPWLAGLWLGLAALSRYPTLFAAIFFIAYALARSRDWQRVFFRQLLPFGLTLATVLFVMLAYNALRFDNPLEFGYRFHQGTYPLVNAINDYGSFNPIFIPCNLYISLVGLPNLLGVTSISDAVCWHMTLFPHGFQAPFEFFDPRGMSIFLTTPAFIYLFKARWREPLVKAALAGTLAVLLVLWMSFASGWVQFGYRFILDFIPLVMIMVASGMTSMTRNARLLISISIIINFLGLIIMFKSIYFVYPFGI